MGYYLVELDGPELERLAKLVREAIEAADENEASDLEALLSALGHVRWQAGHRTIDWLGLPRTIRSKRGLHFAHSDPRFIVRCRPSTVR
jgi:hypothetical protein